jgi:hypothetical protein
MRNSSQKLLNYIAEVNGGFGVTPPDPAAVSTPATSKPTAGPKKIKPLIDPSVMGKDAVSKEAGEAAELVTVPYKTWIGAGAIASPILQGMRDALTAPQRAREELKIQQEAQREMLGVSNFYKNLGVKTPSMHGGDVLSRLGQLLGIGGEGRGRRP